MDNKLIARSALSADDLGEFTMGADIIGKYQGRHWLTIQEWSQEELQTMIDAAIKLKKLQKARKPHDYLLRQTLFMIFFNRLFIGTILIDTPEMQPLFFGSALCQKSCPAIGARLRYRFIPYGKSAGRITCATIKQLTSF